MPPSASQKAHDYRQVELLCRRAPNAPAAIRTEPPRLWLQTNVPLPFFSTSAIALMEGLRLFFFFFFNLKHTGDGDSRQRLSSFGQIQILLGANYVKGGGSLTGVMVSGQSIESGRAV